MSYTTPDSGVTIDGIIESTTVYPKPDYDLSANQEDTTISSGLVQRSRYNFKRTLFGYVKTKQFWLVLFFGYVHYINSDFRRLMFLMRQ